MPGVSGNYIRSYPDVVSSMQPQPSVIDGRTLSPEAAIAMGDAPPPGYGLPPAALAPGVAAVPSAQPGGSASPADVFKGWNLAAFYPQAAAAPGDPAETAWLLRYVAASPQGSQLLEMGRRVWANIPAGSAFKPHPTPVQQQQSSGATAQPVAQVGGAGGVSTSAGDRGLGPAEQQQQQPPGAHAAQPGDHRKGSGYRGTRAGKQVKQRAGRPGAHGAADPPAAAPAGPSPAPGPPRQRGQQTSRQQQRHKPEQRQRAAPHAVSGMLAVALRILERLSVQPEPPRKQRQRQRNHAASANSSTLPTQPAPPMAAARVAPQDRGRPRSPSQQRSIDAYSSCSSMSEA
jgi:hypothetical protein